MAEPIPCLSRPALDERAAAAGLSTAGGTPLARGSVATGAQAKAAGAKAKKKKGGGTRRLHTQGALLQF